MIDPHSHILYRVDDGAESISESARMLQTASELGITMIMATPHVRVYPYDVETARERHRELIPIAKKNGINLQLGFEVHWDSLYQMRPEEYADFCFQRTSTMLVEFSLQSEALPQNHHDMIYKLQRAGVDILIAHPERYQFVQKDPTLIERWQDMGCRLQLDANCLLSSFESGSKKAARRFLKQNAYEFVASDAHSAVDYEEFGRAVQWIRKNMVD